MKDFAAEVRASMDVENFMSEAKLMLDLNESNVEAILDKMVSFMLDNKEEPAIACEEVRKALFTHDSGIRKLCVCMLFAHGVDSLML